MYTITVSFQTLHITHHISELLLAMRQFGNIQYTNWSMILPCQKHVITELQKVAKEIESELEDWKMTIDDCRQKFYNLNYYTTRQLLILRKELGRLKFGAAFSVCPEVLTLLQCISPSMTSDDLNKAVRKFFLQQWKNSSQRQQKPEDVTKCLVTDSMQKSDDKDNRLTPKQREIYKELTDQMEFDKKLALAAVHNCNDVYDAANWCMEKINEDGQEVVDKTEEPHAGNILDSTRNDDESLVQDIGKIFLWAINFKVGDSIEVKIKQQYSWSH